ncbi:MAG TPA: dihydrolipoamide acetyltransferase family protein [Bellilinea sp.]|nr:dihydrolipoamide acetyltransferase family protein [Bellilinea sp.]
MMATKVIMPQLGESVVEGTVTSWLKKEGETIAEYESLLEVNTDKVDTEIPASAGGTLLKILVPEGTTVRAGTVLAWIGEPGEVIPVGESVEQAAGEPALRQAQGLVDEPIETQPVTSDRDLGFISPVVARLAKDKQVDLNQVKGTGQGGRITKKDVLDYLESGALASMASISSASASSAAESPAPWDTPGEGDLFRPTEMMFSSGKPPEVTPAGTQQPGSPEPAATSVPRQAQGPGGDRLIPHTTMRKRIAEHMVLSKHTSPHVTTVMESDFKRVVAHYEKNKDTFARDGVKLTYTAYFAAAAAAALRAFPLVNSSWSDEGVILHPQVNLSIAVSLGEEGLIVPVIPNADGLSLLGLARAINDLAARARAHHLKPDEVRGGTFSITNHGTSGSLFATPVINQPQCAILGVGAVKKRAVVVEGDAIAVRPMVYLSLTFDHRILDGASADGFLAKVVEILDNWPA